MLTNVRVVAFTVSELFRKNQKGGGDYSRPTRLKQVKSYSNTYIPFDNRQCAQHRKISPFYLFIIPIFSF